MRVAMYYANNDVQLEEKPKPKAGPGELLVKIEASGICGTDCMEWYRIHRVPLILGHEIAGTVVEAGRGVTRYKTGNRVVASHHVPCGTCRYCKAGHQTVCDTLRLTNFDPGGFCEFVRIPKINTQKGVYLIPKNVSFEEATFAEPLACVLRGQRLARVKKGDTVLVLGSGLAGILHVQVARHHGAKNIVATDVSKYRLRMAKRLGAKSVFDGRRYTPGLLTKINEGRLADIVIVCAGAASACEQALRSVERGGTVLFFAATGKGATIPLPVNDVFWRNEITLTSSYAATPKEHVEALRLISSRKIDVHAMISHTFGLAETGTGFTLVSEAKNSMKIIIKPQE